MVGQGDEPCIIRLRKVLQILDRLFKKRNILEAVVDFVLIIDRVVLFGEKLIVTNRLIHDIPVPKTFIVAMEYRTVIAVFVNDLRGSEIFVQRVCLENSEFQSNWELSAHRSINFMNLLLKNEKLDPKKFSQAGYGEYQPVAPNNTAEGRAKNRRVEVKILPFNE